MRGLDVESSYVSRALPSRPQMDKHCCRVTQDGRVIGILGQVRFICFEILFTKARLCEIDSFGNKGECVITRILKRRVIGNVRLTVLYVLRGTVRMTVSAIADFGGQVERMEASSIRNGVILKPGR